MAYQLSKHIVCKLWISSHAKWVEIKLQHLKRQHWIACVKSNAEQYWTLIVSIFTLLIHYFLLDPHKESLLLRSITEKYTHKKISLKMNHSDLLIDLLSPYSLKSNGPRCVCQPPHYSISPIHAQPPTPRPRSHGLILNFSFFQPIFWSSHSVRRNPLPLLSPCADSSSRLVSRHRKSAQRLPGWQWLLLVRRFSWAQGEEMPSRP